MTPTKLVITNSKVEYGRWYGCCSAHWQNVMTIRGTSNKLVCSSQSGDRSDRHLAASTIPIDRMSWSWNGRRPSLPWTRWSGRVSYCWPVFRCGSGSALDVGRLAKKPRTRKNITVPVFGYNDTIVLKLQWCFHGSCWTILQHGITSTGCSKKNHYHYDNERSCIFSRYFGV